MKIKVFVFTFLLSVILFGFIALAQECVKYRPTVSISPKTLSGPAGTTFLYLIEIRNEDTKICPARKFNIVIDAPGLNFFVNPSSLIILPTETGSALLSITAPIDSPPGIKKIDVAVVSDTQLSTDSAELNVIEEPKSCQVFVNNVELLEEGSSSPQTDFCTIDKIKIRASISLVGGKTTSVNINSYLNEQLFDSKILTMVPGSSATFIFDRVMDAKALGLASVSVKVDAKATCDPIGNSRTAIANFKACEALCEFSVSIIAPSEKTVGENIEPNVLLKNKGKEENVIHLYPYLCKLEGACREIDCGGKTFSIPANSFKNFFCMANTTETGLYQFKLETFSCGKKEVTFSNVFHVNPVSAVTPTVGVSGVCTEKFLDEYTCVGNIKQRAFQNLNCSKTWSDIEYCPFGCSLGKCSKPTISLEPTYGTPEIFLKREYKIEKCGISVIDFDVKNSGPSKDTFTINVSGNISEWIRTDRTIILEKDEQRTFPAYFLVPCEAKSGKYDFTISVKSKNIQSAVFSLIDFKGEQPVSILPNTLIFASLFIVFALLVLFVLCYSKVFARIFK